MTSKAIQNTVKFRVEQAVAALWPDQAWTVSVQPWDEDIMDNALKVDMVSSGESLYAYVYVQKWRSDPLPSVERMKQVLEILKAKISVSNNEEPVRVP